ncbi:MAG: chorismate synthase [Flavobacteriales bacterium]|nr:chorismate synthase [Flavobacteriales bacterium]MBL0044579.1 chorismate synthase [Flavobacteriales bacterium]
MPGNSFGSLFRLTTFGESHGVAIGGVVDGCPAGLKLDLNTIQHELDRRKPGSTPLGTSRKEADTVEFLSGILENTTLGTPIGFLIRNSDAQSGDYDHLKDTFRPGHADLTWEQKFGIRDHRGGGRASARETACRVVGGAIARQLIAHSGIAVHGWVSQVGAEHLQRVYTEMDLASVWSSDVRCPDAATALRMTQLIEDARSTGDTVGGCVTCVVKGTPTGLGEPVFDKLHADLGKAMLSVNAVKGFQIGSGFAAAGMRGSEHNDAYVARTARVGTLTNRSGGVQGGISNGEDIIFDVAFKPVSTLMRDQSSIDREGKPVILEGKGRHDPCVVPRAVPVVEAMACLVIADHLLRQRSSRM